MSKFAIIYAYYEKDEHYRKNLDYFIRFGVYPNDENFDYYFIINGETDYDFPQYSNLHVFFRENSGFDFAGYNRGIEKSLFNETDKPYEYFIFINASCRGPFLPCYCDSIKWSEPFLNLFTKDPKIEMVGVTINLLCSSFRPHIQSYFFMLKRKGLFYLKEKGLFDKSFDDMIDVIYKQEVEMSLLLLRNDMNISCIIPEFQNISYNKLLKQLNEGESHNSININNILFEKDTSSDILFPGKRCFGRDAHPYELIFIKTGNIYRKISTEEVESITNYNLQHKKLFLL